MLKKLDKGLCWFEDIILVIGLLSTAVVLFVNVVLRYCFSAGLTWAEEFARYAVIWITCAGCGAAVRNNSHMSITAVLDTVGAKAAFVLKVIIHLISLAFSVFMTIYGWRVTELVARTNQRTPAMEIPMAWIYVSIIIGGITMIIRFTQSLVRLIKSAKTPAEEGKDGDAA